MLLRLHCIICSIDLDKLRNCHHEGRPTACQAVQEFAYNRYGNLDITRSSKHCFHTVNFALDSIPV